MLKVNIITSLFLPSLFSLSFSLSILSVLAFHSLSVMDQISNFYEYLKPVPKLIENEKARRPLILLSIFPLLPS
jgi:hypothetical protein